MGSLRGRGQHPLQHGRQRQKTKPPLAYLRAVLVKMLFEINSFSKLVQRFRNNPDLTILCGFDDPPSKMGFSRFMKRLSEAELDQRLFQEALKQLMEVRPRRRGGSKKGR